MVPINEKRKPHYNLARLKRLVRKETWIITSTAYSTAISLGFSRFEIKEIILELVDYRDFYKSMTTHRSHKIWQDVYKPRIPWKGQQLELYIKLQESADRKCVVISFKKSGE